MDGLFLDFNGLLVDDEHLHLQGFNAVLAPRQIHVSEALYAERYLGFDDRGAFEHILRDHGHAPTPPEVDALIAAKAEVYASRARSELRVFPGAAELVRAAAGEGPVAVVSGALRAEVTLGLERLGVRALVGCVVAAEDVARSKPDPEGYRAALAWLRCISPGSEASRVVALEDSGAGLVAAQAAGLVAVGVAHTYPPEALEASGARRVFPSLVGLRVEDLAALVASGGQRGVDCC
ncbi:MAG: HAD family phosphatase [Deltaproteobacteria bacterium]|nr:HAD family phosphatase [Deltaproteobacteria bacterium]